MNPDYVYSARVLPQDPLIEGSEQELDSLYGIVRRLVRSVRSMLWRMLPPGVPSAR